MSTDTTVKLGIWGWVARIESNNAALVRESRYFDDLVMESLRTDIYKVDRLADDVPYDAEMLIHDQPGAQASVEMQPGRIEAA